MPIQRSLRVHQITKQDLMFLLDKSHLEILRELNRVKFGFIMFLEKQCYSGDEEVQILEIVIRLLGQVCTLRGQKTIASLRRLFRMLKDCQKFLFEDVPRVINSCFSKSKGIDLVSFMAYYMNILCTVLSQDFFPCEIIVNNIFPSLENYMNRLRERKFKSVEIAEDCFRDLVRKIEHYEKPAIFDEDDDDEVNSFRQLSIVPRSNDIVNYEIANIPQNIIDRPYRSVDHFLSVYYRLTREDMLRSFRECVRAYSMPNMQGGSLNKNHIFDISVIFSASPKYTLEGILYEVKVISSKEIDWSKKEVVLLPGSLIILTPDSFKSVIFATVKKNLRSNTSKSKEIKLTIKLEDDLFIDELEDLKYKMIVPTAYFECYKHVLSSIKDFTEATFPLSDIITYLDYSDPEPEYMDGTKYCLHEKCGGKAKHDSSYSCKMFNPLKDDEWPEANDLKLDDQQYHAFKMAMTKKVAVIQGPPGTGKTYIGVKIVKALLENTPHKPIIICCLTNHALDQFLEHILKFTKKVVRLGCQSKSKILEPHTMDNLIYAVRQYHTENTFDKAQQKSLDLIKDFVSIVLTQKIIPEYDYEFIELKENLCPTINANLKLFQMCKDEYLTENALNNIIDSKFKDQLRIVSGSIPKSLNASILEWLNCCHEHDLYEKCRKKFQEFKNKEMNISKTIKDIWALLETERFELFCSWRNECMKVRKKLLDDDIEKYKVIMRRYKSKQVDLVKLEILRNAYIIGVTTTGACKYKNLIHFSEPHIIVIEEAAQVLESHVIASLIPHIQHMILIGDHEQLRPLPANHELSERYNLKISMFERLFRNGAPFATLVSQHRMKPCIAELLVPRPYINYTSFKNVYEYEEIRGVQSSMYFIDHSELEDKNSSGTSSSNDFEARMIISLVKYFELQSYPLKDITIIATYKAQVVLIHKYLVEKNLESIHVTTVDDYQGEENEIILVSFVRSNPSAIGFLKESNRVCVALSRAKKGMFCFGNFKLFESKSDLWKGIVEKVREKNMIGDGLILKCEKHNTVQTVKSDEDIFEFIDGGCLEICNFLLPCKHSCERRCHFDDLDHMRYHCQQPCDKMIDENRVCSFLCFEKCETIKKKQVELPCGHFSSGVSSLCFEEIQRLLPCHSLTPHFVTVPCYLDIQKFKCKAKESIDLDCGHTKSVYCHERYEEMNITCTKLRPQTGICGHIIYVPCSLHLDENDLLPLCDKACGMLLDCGHPCVGFCRSCLDTGIHQFCTEKCEFRLSCGHKCDGYCSRPCPPCKQKCFRSCSHHTSCINECLRPCIKCEKSCTRVCIHSQCSELCHEVCSVKPCVESCSEVLPCGHLCIGFCGDPCPYLCRLCHADELTGNLNNDRYVQLECTHVLQVDELTEHIEVCLMSFEWPSCPQCSTPITHSVRFKEELIKAKNICIKSYDTTANISEILYLVQSLYGEDFIVPAKFLPIHNRITHILNKQKLHSDSLTVLKCCIMQLKKLVTIAPELVNLSNEHFQGRFDTLLSWIFCHLTTASFQQLKELKLAVNQLSKEI